MSHFDLDALLDELAERVAATLRAQVSPPASQPPDGYISAAGASWAAWRAR